MFTPDPKEIDTVLRLNLQQKYRYFVSKSCRLGGSLGDFLPRGACYHAR